MSEQENQNTELLPQQADSEEMEVIASDGIPESETPESTSRENAPLSPTAWLCVMLLMCIPIVNLVLLTAWACGGCKNRNRITYARGSLLFLLVWLLVLLIAAVTILAVAGGAFLAYSEGLTQMIPSGCVFAS